mmetsp:Transcript_8867/g.28104  ORF Transcript_8867/g.28104 Transcript_8867/m.28104 type:complete len:415 (+) Transcript_8867:268-1512(+)
MALEELVVARFARREPEEEEEDEGSCGSSGDEEETLPSRSPLSDYRSASEEGEERWEYYVCDPESFSSVGAAHRGRRRRFEAVSCGLFDCRRAEVVEARRARSSSSVDDEEEACRQLPLRRREKFAEQRDALDRLPTRLAKRALLERLDEAEGEPRAVGVVEAVRQLATECRLWDEPSSAAAALRAATGSWRAVTRADFPGSVGRDSSTGAYAYTLGRMSFGLFSPSDVVLAVDDCRAVCRPLDLFERPLAVPDALRAAPRREMRGYNIEVAFTVLDARARGLSGTMTTYGYCVAGANKAPDADHRLDVWFVAGDLRPDALETAAQRDAWAALFGRQAQTARDNRSLVTRATLWFVSVALGISLAPVRPEGVQSYTVARPVTGHVDVLFADDDLRVTRGNRNSLVVMRRATTLL